MAIQALVPLLLKLLPYLGAAGAGYAGARIGSSGQNQNSGGNFFTGTPERTMLFNRFSPDQQQALSSALQQALGGLGQNNFDFAPIEQQARENFSQQTIPSIAERFTSMGAQKSNAFNQALSGAGAGLETNLAALKSAHGMNQQQLLQNLLGLGLTSQNESIYRPSQPGFLQNTAQAASSALPYVGASYLMNKYS